MNEMTPIQQYQFQTQQQFLQNQVLQQAAARGECHEMTNGDWMMAGLAVVVMLALAGAAIYLTRK